MALYLPSHKQLRLTKITSLMNLCLARVIVEADYSNTKSVQFQMVLNSGVLQLRKYLGKIDGKSREEKIRLVIND
jgi:hypothetical protein